MKEWIVIHKIKALYNDGNGLSRRAIAAELGISRNSVRKYLNMSVNGISQQQEDISRTKLLDIHNDYIVHLLKNFPNLSAVKIMRKLREKYNEITVSDRTVRRYVERQKESVNCKQPRYYQPVLDMVPGVQCQVDPGELRNVMIGGVETTIYFVVFVLSYSRLMHVSISSRPINTDILIGMHDTAFRYFGGCSEECVYDQTKMVVIKEEYRELKLNQRFNEYATHAGFTIRACEGYDPESKGKVESGVKYVKQNALYGEIFSDWTDLESYMANWLETVANVRCHGTTGEAPCIRFEASERAYMRLYNTPTIVRQSGHYGVTRKADKTGLISWVANKYSVPMLYQRSEVGVHVNDGELIIHDLITNQELARHSLSYEKGKVIQNRHHYRDMGQLVDDLEVAITEQLGHEYGVILCALLKATSPKIYKDQLRGVKQILSGYDGTFDKEILTRLCKRPCLTATGVKDFLAAYTSKRSGTQEKNKSEQQIRADSDSWQLACYSQLTKKRMPHVVH